MRYQKNAGNSEEKTENGDPDFHQLEPDGELAKPTPEAPTSRIVKWGRSSVRASRLLNTAPFIGSYILMSDTRRSQSQPRFEYLGCAAGFQETRDVRKRVLRRPHYGRLAVRVLS